MEILGQVLEQSKNKLLLYDYSLIDDNQVVMNDVLINNDYFVFIIMNIF